MSISQNLFALKTELPPSVTLVAVSKNQPEERIKEAYAAGQRIFGENRNSLFQQFFLAVGLALYSRQKERNISENRCFSE